MLISPVPSHSFHRPRFLFSVSVSASSSSSSSILNLLLLLLLLLLCTATFAEDQPSPFEDVSLRAGLRRPFGRRRKYGGAAVADLDGDGWPDLLLGHHNDRSMQVYFNERNGTFSLSSFVFWRDLHGLNPFRPHPRARTLSFIASTGGSRGKRPRHPHVFHVRADRTISDVTAKSPDLAKTFRRGRSAIFMSLRKPSADNNNNGNNNNTKINTRPQPDVLLLNRVDGTNVHHRAFQLDGGSTGGVAAWVEQPLTSSTAFIGGVNRYGGVTDIDNDGVMEVVMKGTFHMYRVQSDFQLRDITSQVLPRVLQRRRSGGSNSLVAMHGWAELDYNGDGRWDLFITRSATGVNRFYKRAGIRDHLLRNVDGKRYVDATFSADMVMKNENGKWDHPSSHGVTVGDFDNDGHVDILLVHYSGNPGYTLLCNLGTGKFSKLTSDLGFQRDSAVDGDTATAVDYDLDGRVDLILSEGTWGMNDGGNGFYRLIRNVWRTGNGFLLVRVRNAPKRTVTNLHAVVSVRMRDGRVQMRRVGTPGSLVSNSLVETVHFGVGRDESVREIRVSWTDGSVSRRRNVRANSTITIGV